MTARTPQLIIALQSDYTILIESPSANGARRKIAHQITFDDLPWQIREELTLQATRIAEETAIADHRRDLAARALRAQVYDTICSRPNQGTTFAAQVMPYETRRHDIRVRRNQTATPIHKSTPRRPTLADLLNS